MADPIADTGTPRWVKVAGLVALVVVVLIIIAVVTGRHDGPSRHSASDGKAATSAQRL
jgi:hypothetical protein